MIQKRPFGNWGFSLPEVGLGTWALGGDAYGPVSPETARAVLESAYQKGVFFWDTADFYGFGEAERRIGNFLKSAGARKDIFIATKGGLCFEKGPVRKDFSYDYLKRALDETLVRLGTETVDLYQLHGPRSEDLKAGDCLRFLRDSKRAGKIRFGGVSLHDPMDVKDWLYQKEIEVLQLPFNLIARRLELILDHIQESGKALVIREVFASGFLSGRYSEGTVFPKNDHRRILSADDQKKIFEEIRKLELGSDPKIAMQEAIRFSLKPREVSVALFGVRDRSQLEEDLKLYAG